MLLNVPIKAGILQVFVYMYKRLTLWFAAVTLGPVLGVQHHN